MKRAQELEAEGGYRSEPGMYHRSWLNARSSHFDRMCGACSALTTPVFFCCFVAVLDVIRRGDIRQL